MFTFFLHLTSIFFVVFLPHLIRFYLSFSLFLIYDDAIKYSGKSVLNQKTELQKVLQKQKERISQQLNRGDDETASTNHGIGQELAQEIARRNMRNIEGNSSKADESEALNEEYLRIKSSLKHNRINSSDI